MEKNKKKIIIVGAGPGGLVAGMILAHQGFEVTIFEKENKVGGRNAYIEKNGYRFDIGPTFLMMKFILDEIFAKTGRQSKDYLNFTKLDPMYDLYFADKKISISSDDKKMKDEIKKVFPGEEDGLDKFYPREKKKYDKTYPCLTIDYSSLSKMIGKNLRKAIPYLTLGKSVHQVIGKYFKSEDLKLCFNFQTKYLGMSPWECPGAFTIIPYVEHTFGIYHVEGGLSEISEAMAKVIEEDGGKIKLSNKVKNIITENKTAKGVELENGEKFYGDSVVINADFAYAMANLVDQNLLKKYKKEKLPKKKFSCSTFMLYLGIDKIYPELQHHSIFFSKDYKTYVNKIFNEKELVDDISFYIRNSSINDKKVAPEGHSNIYVLVPVPNNKSNTDWEKEKNNFRNKVIKAITEKTKMKDLENHIKEEIIITPKDWEKEYNVFLGATFNLAHNLMQMLYFRPRNRFEEIKNCYLVGGGTHPGSGLPTIYESGRISADLIVKDLK